MGFNSGFKRLPNRHGESRHGKIKIEVINIYEIKEHKDEKRKRNGVVG